MNAQGLDVDVDPSPQEPGRSRDLSESEDSEGEMGGCEEDIESEPATDDDAISVSGSLIKLVFF